MAGALAAQLKKMRISQTNFGDKRRQSLLFEPMEAANVDRETVFSIGQSGLQELVKYFTLFDDFKITLFSQTSVSFDRAVEDATVNEKLDIEIKKFLLLLSPYFLLAASHKVLEWLIYRYYIHKHNKDQFILLILPYHGTPMFVKALHLVDLSDEDDKWHWLASLQKRNVPLDSGTFINHLSTDDGLLQMLCTHVVSVADIFSTQASDACPTVLYAFYANVVKGVIENASTLTEVQINHLLPTLFYGLKSPIRDFVGNIYAIIMKMITKVKFSPDITEKLLLTTFEDTLLKRDATFLLLYLYQSPVNGLSVVPRSLVLLLSDLSWFVEKITKIHSSIVNASPFIVSFLQTACQIIIENPKNTSSIQNMIDNMLATITLDDDAVDVILSSILSCEFLKNEMSEITKNFLSKFCQIFERSYPERFDRYVRNMMEQNEDLDSKQVLNFLTPWLFGTKNVRQTVEILYKLMHETPTQRIKALEFIVKNNVSESCRDTLIKLLKDRFHDNVSVALTLLSFPTERLIELLHIDILVNELLILLSTCHTESKIALAQPALKILLEVCEQSDDTRVFITLLPFLFPTADEDIELAMEVLRSNFAKNNMYMQHVIEEINKSKLTNAETISSVAFQNILNHELLPPMESVLNSVQQQISQEHMSDATSLFFNMILLGSICKAPVGSMPVKTACDIIDMATEMIKRYTRVELLHDCNDITGGNCIQMALKLTFEGILPLQVGTYVMEMVHRQLNIRSESKLDFDDNAERSNLILRLIEIFIEGMDNCHWRQHYSRCLQIFFQLHFATARDLICFLAQLYTKPVKVQTSCYCLLISSLVLDQCQSVQWAFQDQDFVINLLLSLARRNSSCRTVALEILKKLTQIYSIGTEPFFVLLQELTAKSTEISQDPNQFLLKLRDLFLPNSEVSRQAKQRKKLQQAQKFLFDVVMQQTEASKIPMYRRSQLLDVLVHVNNIGILQQLIPLGIQLLKTVTDDPKNRSAGSALRNILQRFNGTTVGVLNDEQAWSFFETSIVEYKPRVITEIGEQTSPCFVLLKQIDETFFENAGTINSNLQRKIMSKILDIMIDCEIDDVIFAADTAIRQIQIDARILRSELEMMKLSNQIQEESTTLETKKKAKKRKKQQNQVQLPNPAMVHSRAWKRGIILLKFAQYAENIKRKELLYDILFDLMNICLSLKEQDPVEYTNQLILSTIYRLMIDGLPVRDADLQTALIAKCVRISRNIQTQHFALLVLVELLKHTDVHSALCNVMPIFTFLGSTAICQDDDYSIEISSRILDILVPIVNVSDETHACELLRIFLISLPHIPEHRQAPIFNRLLQLLYNHQHLFYLLIFKSHAKIVDQQTKHSVEYLKFACDRSQEFRPQQLLQICIKVIEFVKTLPIDIKEKQGKKAAANFPYKHIYDVTESTPKIFRHYQITAVQFVDNILTSQDFTNRVTMLNQDEMNEMHEYYNSLAMELILLIQGISEIADQHSKNLDSAKYWIVLLHCLYNTLNTVNNMLPNISFLKNIKSMLKHNLFMKKKGLELLNTRLLRQKFAKEDHPDLLNMIDSLMQFLDVITDENHDIILSVLMCFKLLVKLLARDHPNYFKPLLDMMSKLLQLKDSPVLISAIFCIAELCSSMGTHAIYSINSFMPVILDLIKTHRSPVAPNMIISLTNALQNIIETLGEHLYAHLDNILFELIMLSSLYINSKHSKGMDTVVLHLKTMTENICSCISLQVLLPSVKSTYQTMLTNKFYQHIPSLMNILAESFANSVQPANLKVELDDFIDFFLDVLQLRENNESIEDNIKMDNDERITLKDIVIVEESASKAFVALISKLNAETFKSLYNKLCEWVADTQHKQRNITFYRISANIAECLKSMFVSYAGINSLKRAALLLNSNNTFIIDSPQELTLPVESNRIELVEMILLTLDRIYNCNKHNFVCKDQFEILMQSIVDQLENTMGTREEYESRASQLIVPCIASFASAISESSLHEQLIQQLLLKTRHEKLHVRTTALNVLVEIARKLRKNFIQLLPAFAPFLTKMLEDKETKKCTQNIVCTLEKILEEPLQKYF